MRYATNAFDEGYEAYLLGMPDSENPHDTDGFDARNHEDWRDGWEQAEYDNTEN